MKNLEKMKKSMRGITLIALVVTIIVLLILAAIAVNLTIGENGIIARADGTRILQSHADIKDSTIMIEDEYVMEKQVEDKGNDLIGYAIITGYCDENGKINVEKMTGHDTGYGKGTDKKDVYLLEKEETKYIVNYYDKEGNKTTIIELAGDVLSDGSIFKYVNTDTYNGIAIKYEHIKKISSAQSEIVTKDGETIKSIVIPERIDGHVVEDVKLVGRGYYMNYDHDIYYLCAEDLHIPSTAKSITSLGEINLSGTLYIPKSVTKTNISFRSCFQRPSEGKIVYEGTVAEWKSIEFGNKNWTSVQCSDGIATPWN